MSSCDLSIVIACYNEAPHLRESVMEIRAVMDQTDYNYELIFVDDCSQDDTRSIIEEITATNPDDTCYIFHEENTGRGGAVSDGILHAKGKFVGFLDIDLEVHARYIPTMLLSLERGSDIATALRIYKLDASKLLRHVLSHGYRKLSKFALGGKCLDTETGYKFFRRDRILPILSQVKDTGWFWDTEIMIRAERNELKISEIPCLFIRRKDKLSTVKLWSNSLDYLVKLYRFRKELS